MEPRTITLSVTFRVGSRPVHEPAGERSPCPDCGLVWCQAVAAANVQYHEVGGMTLASYDGATPCERPATRARQDGMTVCTAHQAGDEILGVRPTRR
jgi:hypothetical protein